MSRREVSWSYSYLNSAAALLLQEDVLRLHVAVDDLVPVEEVEALQQRVGELADELEAESLELVLLDELVEVDAEDKVARWQNLIPSSPWIAPGWRAWGRNPRKGRDQILQRSIAEP